MSREILHIPCGFRCHTKREMRKKLNIKQASLPFDSGFFTPSSIIKFMEDNVLEINLENTNPCIKTRNFIKDKGNKILSSDLKFEETNYNLINKFIEDNGYENSYLDSTKGYYTLIKKYGFVLAHYNWHPISNRKITNPEENIEIINETFNRRKTRLLELIDNSSQINLYLYQVGTLFVQINNTTCNIKDDFLLLENYFIKRFANKKIKTIYMD